MLRLLYLLFFLLPFAAVQAVEDFHVLPLKYRVAEELAPALKGLFGERARFSQLDSRLVVACDDKTYSEILHLLAQLDHKPHQLRISAKIMRNENLQQKSMVASGKVENGKANLATSAEAQTISSQEKGVRTILAQEGYKASFRNAELMQVANGSFTSQQGFTVIARLQGEKGANVELESHDDKAMHITALSTSVHGNVEEWFPVGTLNQSQFVLWLKISVAD